VICSILKVFLGYVCLLLSNDWLCVDILRARARVCVRAGNSLFVTLSLMHCTSDSGVPVSAFLFVSDVRPERLDIMCCWLYPVPSVRSGGSPDAAFIHITRFMPPVRRAVMNTISLLRFFGLYRDCVL
jgi:hypothetical protein